MSMTTRRLAVIVALVMSLGLAGCSDDDEPDPIPTPTETPTAGGPEVSPAPDAPDLDDDQQTAYDAAVQRYAEFEDFNSRIAADPNTSQEVADELFTYTVEPATSKWAASLDQLIEDGIYIEGRSKVEWTVPVEVADDQVVFRQCESPGDWMAHQGEESSPQTNNILTEVTVVELQGAWRIMDQEGAGEC